MKRQQSGFTLIELLISISLLSMIMLLASWSFSMFIDRWEGRLGNFSRAVSESKDFILLNNVISTVVPYLVEQENSLGYYFILKQNTLKAVSQNGIFHTTGPVFFKLSVEKKLTGEQYLLYQEGALSGKISLDSELPYSHEKVLIDNSSAINFQVYSWQSYIEKINSDNPLNNINTVPQWRAHYNAWQSKIMPLTLRVFWSDSSLDISFINDHGRWFSIIEELKNNATYD